VAAQIARPGETYSAEKFGDDCVRCQPPTEDSLTRVLAVAVKKGKADFGTLQVLDQESGALRIVAQQGLSRKFLDFFSMVPAGFAACGTALKRGERVLVDDVASDSIFTGKRLLKIMLGEKVRSVQSVPLTASPGQLVGVLAVHYSASGMASISAHHLDFRYIQDIADHLQRFSEWKKSRKMIADKSRLPKRVKRQVL